MTGRTGMTGPTGPQGVVNVSGFTVTNQVLTTSTTASTINANPNLTFNGSTLTVTGNLITNYINSFTGTLTSVANLSNALLLAINYSANVYIVEYSMRSSNVAGGAWFTPISGGALVQSNAYVALLYSYSGTPLVSYINGVGGGPSYSNNTGATVDVFYAITVRSIG